jgi:hypothetical protein
MNKTIVVTQGEIVINDVTITEERDGFLVMEADLHSKYAEAAGYGGMVVDGQPVPCVFLMAGEHTLKTSPDAEGMSMITLPARCKGWHVIMEAARYTVRIVAWRPSPDRERDVLWQDTR